VALPPPPASGPPLPLEAEAMRAASAASRRDQPDPLTGPSPLSGPGPLASPRPLNDPGPLNTPGPLSAPGPLSGPASRSGPGPLNDRGPLASPDPLTGPKARSGPAPLNGPGPLGGPSSASGPAPLNGPGPLGDSGPLSRPDPVDGPSRASGPSPAAPPAPANGQKPIGGPAALNGPARGTDRAATRLTPPAGPARPNGPALLEPERPDPAPRPEPRTSDAASLMHAAPVTADMPAVAPARDRSAGGPLSPTRDFAPARDFPAGTPIPPGAGTVLADLAAPAGPPVPAAIPRQGPAPAAPLNGLPAPATPAAAESPRRRRSAKRRMATERIFGELASLAAIPASAYSVGEEVDGAMCLLETADGFEVFTSSGGSRHEVRVFSDEESACFYLFGVLAADAVRTGVLVPGQTARESIPARPRDPLAGLGEPLLHR
jgi:hypothetical protein